MQKEDIVFLVTGAHDIKSATDTLLRERYLEYMIALQKIFLYNKPTYGVLSEYNEKRNHIPPFNIFSFNKYVKLLPIDLRICTTKSQQEFYSIQILIKDMDLDDNTFIIKLSGRYVILKDTLFEAVESVKNDNRVQGIVSIVKNSFPLQQYTFLFALRWKWFKKFYSLPLEQLGGKCVETFIVEFFEREELIQSIMNVEKLNVLAQICNGNDFKVY